MARKRRIIFRLVALAIIAGCLYGVAARAIFGSMWWRARYPAFTESWRKLEEITGAEIDVTPSDGTAAVYAASTWVSTYFVFRIPKSQLEALAAAFQMKKTDDIDKQSLCMQDARNNLLAPPFKKMAFNEWRQREPYAFGAASGRGWAVWFAAVEEDVERIELFVHLNEGSAKPVVFEQNLIVYVDRHEDRIDD